jgi:hypothetical protein
LDITAAAAGSSNVEIEFRLETDGGLEFGGWNIDDLTIAVIGPAPDPGAPSFSVSPAAVAAIGGATVTADGTGMGGVTSVTVGGVSVPFTQGAGEVEFVFPAAASLGNMPVVVTTPFGVGQSGLNVSANASTALAGTTSAALGAGALITLGAPEPGFGWLLFSPLLGPTALPGIVDLAIGAGDFLSLTLFQSGALNAAGNMTTPFVVPNLPGLSGFTVYFEGIAYGAIGAFSASGAHAFNIL